MFLAFVLAFLLGLLLGSALPYFPFASLAFLTATAGALLLLEMRRRLSQRLGHVVYAGILVGLLYWTGAAWLHGGASTGLVPEGGPWRIAGTVDAPAHYAPGRAVVLLSVSGLGDGSSLRPVRGRLRLTWRDPGPDLKQGDRVTLTARLHEPSGLLNPGGFDYAAYLIRQGVDMTATVAGPEAVVRQGVTDNLRWSVWRAVEGWRNEIRRAALASLDPAAAGIFLGMIVGQPGYLSQDLRDTFMASGTVHILSISGSHIGLVAFLSFFVIKTACRRVPADWLLMLSRRLTPTRLAAAGTAVPVVLYTLLAGSEVATVRSLVMILLFLLAVWLGRQEQLFLTLACAALLILLHEPRAIFDISFQLSYCSVLAIAWIIHLRKAASGEDLSAEAGAPVHPGHRLLAWLRTYAWITGGVTLATLPLVAYHFNQIAWGGLLANLFVIPLAGLFLVPLGLLSALFVVLTQSQTLPAAWLNQTGLDGLIGLVQAMAGLPGAAWHVASPAIPAIIAFYVLVLAALIMVERPATRMACLAGALGILFWWAWSPRALSGHDTLRVTVLDVGQGDAIVIELPDKQTVLIDGGTRQDTLDMGRAVVAPYLWDRGVFRLDHVIATHPQLDHVGGLISILRLFPVAQYWGNGLSRQELFYRQLRQILGEKSLTESLAQEGQAIYRSRDCQLLVLNPAPGAADGATAVGSGSILNNDSIVTRLDCGPHSFLFTADVELDTLARMALQPAWMNARVVKVPHHGARSSLYEPWLRLLQPDAAIISVGRRNPYGHPAAAVTRAYHGLGIPLYRTDRDGAVWVTARLTSPDMTVRRARDDRLLRVSLHGLRPGHEADNLLRLWRQWREN